MTNYQATVRERKFLRLLKAKEDATPSFLEEGSILAIMNTFDKVNSGAEDIPIEEIATCLINYSAVFGNTIADKELNSRISSLIKLESSGKKRRIV